MKHNKLSTILLFTTLFFIGCVDAQAENINFEKSIEVAGQKISLFDDQWVKIVDKQKNEFSVINLNYQYIDKAKNSNCQILLDDNEYLVSICGISQTISLANN